MTTKLPPGVEWVIYDPEKHADTALMCEDCASTPLGQAMLRVIGTENPKDRARAFEAMLKHLKRQNRTGYQKVIDASVNGLLEALMPHDSSGGRA